MITKGVVEEIVSPFSIRVRIPSIDRIYQSNVHVSKEALDVAVVCTLPGCDINLQVGDIVIVSSDEAEEDLIILGTLYKSRKSTTLTDFEIANLIIRDSAVLPFTTQIGNVDSEAIQCLEGCRYNLKSHLDDLQTQIDTLKLKIESTTT